MTEQTEQTERTAAQEDIDIGIELGWKFTITEKAILVRVEEVAATVAALATTVANGMDMLFRLRESVEARLAALEQPATAAPDQTVFPPEQEWPITLNITDWQEGDFVPASEPAPLDPVPDYHYYRMTEFGIVSRRVDEMADEACRCGQPFMDSLVRVLRERGANTVEESAEHLRLGLLSESAMQETTTGQPS